MSNDIDENARLRAEGGGDREMELLRKIEALVIERERLRSALAEAGHDNSALLSETCALRVAASHVREQALEEAANVADARAQELEDEAPYEDTPDYTERCLVYAKHIRRVATRIRSLSSPSKEKE